MLFWIGRHGTADSAGPHDGETLLLNPHRETVSTSPRRIIAGLRIATTCLFAIAVAYTAYRFHHAQNNPSPPLPLKDNLTVQSRIPGESGRFGLTDGDRLISVNGKPVETYDEYRRAVSSANGMPYILLFDRASAGVDPSSVRVLWYEQKDTSVLRYTDDLRVKNGPDNFEGHFDQSARLRISHVNGIPVSTREDITQALNAKWAGSPVFDLRSPRESATETVLSFTLVDWESRTAVLVAGIATGIIAVGVIWLKGFALSSWGFHVLCLNIALFSLARAVPFPYRTDAGYAFYFFSQALFPASCVFFLVTFCPPKNLIVRPPSLRAATAILGVGVLAAAAGLNPLLTGPENFPGVSSLLTGALLLIAPLALFLVVSSPWRGLVAGVLAYALFGLAISASFIIASVALFPGETQVGLLGTPVFQAWQVWIQALFVFTLVCDYLLRVLKFPVSDLDRKRAATIRIAALFAFLPILVYVPLRAGLLSALTQPRIFAEAALTIFPLVLAHGILRQNMLKVGKLMLESATYVILLLAGFIVYPLAAALLTYLASGSLAGATPLLAAIAVGVTVFLCGAWLGFLRNRFAKSEEIGEGIEAHFLDELHQNTTNAESVNDVYAFLESELQDMFGLDAFEMVLAADALPIGETNLAEFDGRDSGEVQGIDALFRIAADSKRRVFLRDLEEGLGLPDDEISARDAMQALGVSVALPLAPGERPVGILALGRKSAGGSFSRRELDFLARVSKRTGTSLVGVAKRQDALTPVRVIDVFPRVPARFGKFELLDVIGQGGMSYVYRARLSHRDVALKIANHRVHGSPMLRSRFQREAEILAELSHSHIVTLVDSGTVGEEPYIALEYLPRGSLNLHLRATGPIAETAVLGFLRQLVSALAYAADRGVLHRDVKPHNIYLLDDDTVKLGDFGAARFEDDELFTITGEVVGTLAYMSPERLDGNPADWRTDQYALGVTAYELLVGKRPFQGRTLEAQLISKTAWPSLDKHELLTRASADAVSLVSRMLNPEPEDRYPSYAAIQADIAAIRPVAQEPRPVSG